MLKKSITTIGSATHDIMFYTDEGLLLNNHKDLLRQKLIAFEYGAKIYSPKVYFTYGGGAANTAITFANLGLKTKIICSLGNDPIGKEIYANFYRRGINTGLVQKRPDLATGTSLVVNASGNNEHVIFVYRGANDALNLSGPVIKKINTDWVYLASPSAKIFKQFDHLYQYCQKKKIKIAWNPGRDQLLLGLKRLAKYMAQTEVFIVNRDEALELVVGLKNGRVKNNINYLIRNLYSFGSKLTAITDGARGAYLYNGHKLYYQPALKSRQVVNTTGAGDAFASALLAGLIRYKNNLAKALHLGILNSQGAVSKIGAQVGLLTLKDLKKHNL